MLTRPLCSTTLLLTARNRVLGLRLTADTCWQYRLTTRRFATKDVRSQRGLVQMAKVLPDARAEAAPGSNSLLWFRKGAQSVGCMSCSGPDVSHRLLAIDNSRIFSLVSL